MELARQLVQSTQYQQQHIASEDDYSTVLQNIMQYSQSVQSSKENRRDLLRKYIAIAASLILLGLFGVFFIDFAPQNAVDQIAIVDSTVVKKALKGQRLRLVLPDGSKVVLNAESQLTYHLPFGNSRDVELKGEAFFDVLRDVSSPFTVHTDDVTTRVLGTSFNIRAYPDENEKSIAVVSGKVEVADEFGNQAELNPDSKGQFIPSKRKLIIEPFVSDEVVGWKDGILSFSNTPMVKVIKQLERTYGVNFIIPSDQLLKGDYTGTYDNASLEKVLEGLSYNLDFKYERTKNEIKIMPK